MNTIAAFVASHSIGSILLYILAGFVGLIILLPLSFQLIVFLFEGLFAFFGFIFETVGSTTYYFQHKEIFDRQNDLESWLQEKFDEAGIKVRFTKWDIANSYRSLEHKLSASNLLFLAEVPTGKVAIYKRIIGVAMNKFPWIKVGLRYGFSPYRYLDRAWAKEYGVEKYVQPKYDKFCACGCGKVMIRDFEWMILKDVPESAVFFASMGMNGFDCRKLDLGQTVHIHDSESAPCRELIVELTNEQRLSLSAQIREENDKARRVRGYN